ncbi:hypothetical protein POVWA2_092040 [Plasmodium ovale wallikeri]|uniref:STP1 protein n=1 Tax=Plasmodium ovale wallikeri TaxID=864142 RepID=A0A1A9ASJ7_PLAOA|nr:hypothetical protein POVWA2_092040 [Plasmodium ovale wallikeri]
MAGDSGYATNLRVIPIDFFVDMIKDGIKTLIHTYGHKDCGLRHKELCEEIKKIIFNNKKILYEHMDSPSKKEWDTKWDRQRNGIFHKLFDNEGFINMCFPLKKIVNQSIYQLKSKHIKFCKEKEVRRAALVEKPEYNVCIQYNRWIDSQRTAFTNEYLENVKNFKRKSVNKSFITKEHPGGHDPRPTYHNSKLDCTQYNSPPYSYSKKPVEKAPPISLHSPSPPTVGQKSQGKTGSSATDQDNGSAETKLEENKFPIPKSHIPDSQISSLSKTQRGGTSNVKAKQNKIKKKLLKTRLSS